MAWNAFLAVKLNEVSSGIPEPFQEEGGVTFINNTVSGYTTDVTETAAAVRKGLVTAASYVGDERVRVLSGFVYASGNGNCDIMTNARILEEDARLTVRFDNGIELDAELIGADPRCDLALLRTHPEFPVEPLKLTDSDLLKQGEYVLAVSGRRIETMLSTVTFGVVSSPGVILRTGDENNSAWLLNVVESDIALNQTNSGAPLLNLSGEVTAMLSQTLTSFTGASGMSCGITANEMKRIAGELYGDGTVTRGYLGVSGMNIADMEVYLKSSLNLNLEQTAGIYVHYVAPGSPAETAGVQSGDILTGIDDAAVRNNGQLLDLLYQKEPGTAVVLNLVRAGSELTLNAVLE